jgi:hypothetical protein
MWAIQKCSQAKICSLLLCGQMTPGQKTIVKQQAELNVHKFSHLLNWFVCTSGHKGYEDVTPLDECPDMIAFLDNEDNENNTDNPVDEIIECQIKEKKYYFSSQAHNPDKKTSVFDATPEFVRCMLENKKPTMLMYGDSYLKSHEIHVEDAFPIQFPFGLGGPEPYLVKRQVPVSEEACYHHYMRLSLKQFMRPDFILVCYHMLCRSSSFQTGIIKCRSNYKGALLAEKVAELTKSDVEKVASNLAFKQHTN